jgi:hypothetical protein
MWPLVNLQGVQNLSCCCDVCVHLQARPIATGGPFVVHESDAHLTVPEDLQLATDTRAFQRAEFDAHMAAKMQQEEVRALEFCLACLCR